MNDLEAIKQYINSTVEQIEMDYKGGDDFIRGVKYFADCVKQRISQSIFLNRQKEMWDKLQKDLGVEEV